MSAAAPMAELLFGRRIAGPSACAPFTIANSIRLAKQPSNENTRLICARSLPSLRDVRHTGSSCSSAGVGKYSIANPPYPHWAAVWAANEFVLPATRARRSAGSGNPSWWLQKCEAFGRRFERRAESPLYLRRDRSAIQTSTVTSPGAKNGAVAAAAITLSRIFLNWADATGKAPAPLLLDSASQIAAFYNPTLQVAQNHLATPPWCEHAPR